MKKMKFLLLPAFIAVSSILLTAFMSMYPTGAPAGYTGSPGDGHTCTSCHNGSSSSTTGMISTDIPPEGYSPDSTYNITVNVTGSGYKGFEVSPQDPSGTQLGALIAGTNNHLVGGTKYITQNAKINSTPATWHFQWKAPAAGTGDVTFYAAYCISKPVTKLENITVHENTAIPLSIVAVANPDTVFPGDSTHLSATPAGGGGTYTFSWTSVPSGFTSTEQNPWAKPLIRTTYAVEVSDGTGTASSNVTVEVHYPQGILNGAGHVSGFTLNPNPSHGTVKLSLNSTDGNQAVLKMFNSAGEIVYSDNFIPVKGRNTRSYNFSAIPCGLYFIQLSSEDNTETKSIVLY